MIEAREFIDAALERGFEWYAGVPCSFLTPFIDYVLDDAGRGGSRLHYLSMANEGDAVALNAGIALAGAEGTWRRLGISMMQNSGLGNAVSPLTSLTWTFRLPQLLIVTWRGEPGIHDEPQHALMGPITPAMLETMEIPWESFPVERAAIDPALERARAHMAGTGRPYALVMHKGSVAAAPRRPAAGAKASGAGRGGPAAGAETSGAGLGGLAAGAAAAGDQRSVLCAAELVSRGVAPEARPSREEALRAVVAHTPVGSTAVLASTGHCGRELYAIADRPSQLYMVGSLGCVVPLALGLALARPDLRVVALDGDGAALMRLGAFATVGAYRPTNLYHLLLDNGVHDSTGGQATVSASTSFAAIAAACGYAQALETDAVEDIAAWLDAAPLHGPRFARLRIRAGSAPGLPRPKVSPVEVRTRFMRHFGAPR